MKVVSSIKSIKKRDKNSRVVRRRGRIYVINKRNPKFKAPPRGNLLKHIDFMKPVRSGRAFLMAGAWPQCSARRGRSRYPG